MLYSVLDSFNWLDYLIIILVMAATVWIIKYGNDLKNKNDDSLLEYLLMGRRLTLPLFTVTLVATWYGGIFGTTKIAFESGIYMFVTQGLFWYVAYIIFALFVVDKVAPFKAVTLPDLTEKMFGKKASIVCAAFTFINVVPVAYIISLGLFCQMIFGWNLYISMAGGALAVAAYCAWGGFRSVVFSDIIQGSVMIISVFLTLIFSVIKFGGISYFIDKVPSTHFSVMGGESILSVLVWGFIALSTLVDPNFYQRAFAATSPKVAKKGVLLACVVWICFDIAVLLGCLYAKAVIPDADPKYAYFIYSLDILPGGFKGLFVAGILCLILSTIDSYLFIASNTVSFDLFKHKLGARALLFLNKASVFITALFAVLLAVVFDGNIKTVWKIMGSYSAGCILIPVLIAYLKPKMISDKLFAVSSLTSAAVITLWAFYPDNPYAGLDAFYPGSATSLVIIFGGVLYNRINCRGINK